MIKERASKVAEYFSVVAEGGEFPDYELPEDGAFVLRNTKRYVL